MVASAALFVRATGLILEACGAIGYVHGMVLCTCSCKLKCERILQLCQQQYWCIDVQVTGEGIV